MRYEMTVKLTAEKRIRFDTAEHEDAEERSEFIMSNLTPRDFEGCESAMDITKIEVINEVSEEEDVADNKK